MMALAAGCILDLIIGDPHGIPHPVVAMGKMIAALEKRLRIPEDHDCKAHRQNLLRGMILTVSVLATTVVLAASVIVGAYMINRYLGIIAETALTCYILAAGSLRDESMKVARSLAPPGGDAHDKSGEAKLALARRNLSMIVGRDTDRLDEEGIIRATVETVAENASDGVVAPFVYTAIGGPVLGLLYKAVNTMDSMIGYHDEQYEYFGRSAARLDDIVNYLPSRLTALFMIAGAYLLHIADKAYNGGGAYRIWKRDRRKHPSPNSAQTESACAGALGIRLGGPSYYGGVLVDKPYLGDPLRPAELKDVKRANRLMLAAEAITVLLFMSAGIVIYALM